MVNGYSQLVTSNGSFFENQSKVFSETLHDVRAPCRDKK